MVERESGQNPTDASRDGRFLAFQEYHVETGENIHIMSLDGNGETSPFAATSANEGEASFSPDSRFVAYVSDETGRGEVYVRSLSDGGAKTAVSTNGGRWPRWSPSGGELFYKEDTTLMTVPVTLEPSFRATGKPKALFSGDYTQSFDVFPDGKHFAMITFPEADLRELTVVVNWSTEISRLFSDK